MKRLLIPFICCLLAAWSCSLGEASYYVENAQDIITINEGRLVNDNGIVFTMKEDATTSSYRFEEGYRYLILFDVLDYSYHIRLKEVNPFTYTTTVPLPEEEIKFNDPIRISHTSVSKNYWDVVFFTYRATDSNYAQQVFYYHEFDQTTGLLKLHIYVDGNNENPATMEEKDLKVEPHLVSIPLRYFKDITDFALTFDYLHKKNDGSYEIIRRTITE